MNSEKFHYVYISNFFRLIRSQITGHKESVLFYKSCFTTFDNQTRKYKLSRGGGGIEAAQGGMWFALADFTSNAHCQCKIGV